VDTTGREGDSLQKAIDSLYFLPGIDTVLVMEGTYAVTMNADTGLIMHDSLVLLANSIRSCTLDAKNSCGVIYCNFGDSSSHSAEINGFVIENSSFSVFLETPGIKLINSSPYIINCLIKGSKNGIYGEYSYPIIISTDIIENSAFEGADYYAGGGIYFKNSTVYIENCKINDNAAPLGGFGGDGGGGGGFFDSCNITMINNEINSNWVYPRYLSAGMGGNGLCIRKSTARLISNLIKGNYDALGNMHEIPGPGGGIRATNSTLELENNYICENSAGGGGGLYIENCPIMIKGDTISFNEDGAYISDSRNVKIENVVFNGNFKSNSLELSNSSGDINSVIFSDNKVSASICLTNSSNLLVNKSIFYNFNSVNCVSVRCSNSYLVIDKSLIASTNGAILASNNSNTEIKNCLICDNGWTVLTDSTSNIVNLKNLNIYYNTYQPDFEITNFSTNTLSADSNFWWITDSTLIDSMCIGAVDFIPFRNSFAEGAPGEPTNIYSVINYSYNYTSIVDSIGGDPSTLYLEITGHDRNHELREIAVAILKSNIYPTGIAIALLETDTATGIYRGKAIAKIPSPPDTLREDDLHQTIRVASEGDTIRIYANMDTTEVFRVYFRCSAGIEDNLSANIMIKPISNPLFKQAEFKLFLPSKTNIQLSIYDISGRLVDKITRDDLSSGWHTISANNIEKSGVYFYRFSASTFKKNGKFVVIR
jgi:hypothetical protein